MSTVKVSWVIALVVWVTACGDASRGELLLEGASDPPQSPDPERNTRGPDVGRDHSMEGSDQAIGIKEAAADRAALADYLGTSAAPLDLGAASLERFILESSNPAGLIRDLSEAVSSPDDNLADAMADAMGVDDPAVREALRQVDLEAVADAALRGDTETVDRIYADYMRKIDEVRNRNHD